MVWSLGECLPHYSRPSRLLDLERDALSRSMSYILDLTTRGPTDPLILLVGRAYRLRRITTVGSEYVPTANAYVGLSMSCSVLVNTLSRPAVRLFQFVGWACRSGQGRAGQGMIWSRLAGGIGRA